MLSCPLAKRIRQLTEKERRKGGKDSFSELGDA
jgi:hypothetical protein